MTAATATEDAVRYRVESIPQELRDLPRWVVFALTPQRDGKLAKLPIVPGTSAKAKINDPATWRPFAAALADAEARGLWLGFAFGPDVPYTFIDLDDVLGAGGVLRRHAALIVDTLDTYTEVSAGGSGVHVFARGSLPPRFTPFRVPESCRPVEVYPIRGGKFCVVTGFLRPDLGSIDAAIEERTAALASLFPPRPDPGPRAGEHGTDYEGPAGELAPEELADIERLIAPFWTEGRRHFLALHLSGYLARQGVPRIQAADLIDRLAAGDADPGAKLTACHDTYDAIEAGEQVSGWRGLTDRCGLTDADLDPLRRIGDGFWRRTRRPATETNGRHANGADGMAGAAHATHDHDHDHDGADAGAAADPDNVIRSDRFDRAGQDRPLPQLDAGVQDLRRASAAAWDALRAANDPARLFLYGGVVTRVAAGGDGQPPAAQIVTEHRLRYEAARAGDWFALNSKGDRRDAMPPVAVVRDMLAAPTFPLPTLLGITEAPAFAPDGSLPDGAGYHAAGQVYYAPPAGFALPTIPADPTPEQVAAARALILDDLLCDFPFAGDAERAHAVALLLLPFLRGLIAGPTPLHLIDKPTPGTGASLFADVAARLATGHAVAAITESRDEDEWRKKLTATLRTGAPFVLIDNVRRRLDSAALAAALTSTYWSDRILGTSDNVRLPIRCTWLATGNNAAFSSELTRRSVRIRMDAKMDRPWERKPEDFRHPKLLWWIDENRPELVAACLTVGRAWLAAGRPAAPDGRSLGSYEAWSHVLGGVLHLAGVPGFLCNTEEFYASSDTEGAAIRAFLLGWWEEHQSRPVAVAALLPIAAGENSDIDLGSGSEQSQRIRLGKFIGSLRDRRYLLANGRTVCITAAGMARRAQQWQLRDETVDPGADQTDANTMAF